MYLANQLCFSTGIRDERTPGCNLGYYDTLDLLITLK